MSRDKGIPALPPAGRAARPIVHAAVATASHTAGAVQHGSVPATGGSGLSGTLATLNQKTTQLMGNAPGTTATTAAYTPPTGAPPTTALLGGAGSTGGSTATVQALARGPVTAAPTANGGPPPPSNSVDDTFRQSFSRYSTALGQISGSNFIQPGDAAAIDNSNKVSNDLKAELSNRFAHAGTPEQTKADVQAFKDESDKLLLSLDTTPGSSAVVLGYQRSVLFPAAQSVGIDPSGPASPRLVADYLNASNGRNGPGGHYVP